MNKLYKSLIILFALSIVTLVGCKTTEPLLTQKLPRVQTEEILKEYTTEGITVKKINLDTLQDESIKTLLSENDLKQGIYGFEIQGENKDLIYFNSLNSNFTNFEFSIENNILIISAKTEALAQNPIQKTLFLLERTSTSTIQSIKVKISELEPGTTTIYDF